MHLHSDSSSQALGILYCSAAFNERDVVTGSLKFGANYFFSNFVMTHILATRPTTHEPSN